MEFAITIISLSAMAILWYITHNLLGTVKELAKLLKSDNLQEYNMDEISPENLINVWQQEERFHEIDSMSNEALSWININPEKLYKWIFWGNIKKEDFNW